MKSGKGNFNERRGKGNRFQTRGTPAQGHGDAGLEETWPEIQRNGKFKRNVEEDYTRKTDRYFLLE